jgi:hypothetical protein
MIDPGKLVRHERIVVHIAHNCARDEGGSLEVGLQEQASNHLELRW